MSETDSAAEGEKLDLKDLLIAKLQRDLAAMHADRDYWRAQAEQTYPGKGRCKS